MFKLTINNIDTPLFETRSDAEIVLDQQISSLISYHKIDREEFNSASIFTKNKIVSIKYEFFSEIREVFTR